MTRIAKARSICGVNEMRLPTCWARRASDIAVNCRTELKLPGVATGLAWTPTGGDALFIEATMMKGGKGFQVHRTLW